jgi:hypothetical protein
VLTLLNRIPRFLGGCQLVAVTTAVQAKTLAGARWGHNGIPGGGLLFIVVLPQALIKRRCQEFRPKEGYCFAQAVHFYHCLYLFNPKRNSPVTLNEREVDQASRLAPAPDLEAQTTEEKSNSRLIG